jgi:hypothetical protein
VCLRGRECRCRYEPADSPDVFVAWRFAEALAVGAAARARFLWLHDEVREGTLPRAALPLLRHANGNASILVLSAFHSSQLPEYARPHALLTSNGLDAPAIADGPATSADPAPCPCAALRCAALRCAALLHAHSRLSFAPQAQRLRPFHLRVDAVGRAALAADHMAAGTRRAAERVAARVLRLLAVCYTAEPLRHNVVTCRYVVTCRSVLAGTRCGRSSRTSLHSRRYNDMLCYAMLCYAMLCHAMLCYAMLCYAMPCHAMPCHAMPCHAMLCCAMLCCAMLCYAMLCYAMLWRASSH